MSEHEQIISIIDLFAPINDNYTKWYNNKTERGAISRLVKKHGFENICSVIEMLESTNEKPFFPIVTTPYELEKGWARLRIAIKREIHAQKTHAKPAWNVWAHEDIWR